MSWAPGTKTVEDSRHWIRFTRESWKSKEIFDYGIYLKTGVYIGSVGLHTISWEHSCAEFGYWIGSESEGQGYVSEAVGLLEKVAFEMGFQRLEIRCDPNNLNSARLAERLGYQKEGQLRQNLLVSGLRRDTFVFGKLRS